MHPQGHWVGGQAMHRTRELGMGRARSPAGKGGEGDTVTEKGDRQRREEWAELPPIPWAPGDAGASVPAVFLKSLEIALKYLPESIFPPIFFGGRGGAGKVALMGSDDPRTALPLSS